MLLCGLSFCGRERRVSGGFGCRDGENCTGKMTSAAVSPVLTPLPLTTHPPFRPLDTPPSHLVRLLGRRVSTASHHFSSSTSPARPRRLFRWRRPRCRCVSRTRASPLTSSLAFSLPPWDALTLVSVACGRPSAGSTAADEASGHRPRAGTRAAAPPDGRHGCVRRRGS